MVYHGWVEGEVKLKCHNLIILGRTLSIEVRFRDGSVARQKLVEYLLKYPSWEDIFDGVSVSDEAEQGD